LAPNCRILAVGEGQALLLYSVPSWRLIAHIAHCSQVSDLCVRCVSFSADGSAIAVGTDNHELWVWDTAAIVNTAAETSKPVTDMTEAGMLVGHTGSVLAAVFVGSKADRIVSASADCSLRLWCFSSGEWQCTSTLKGHSQAVRSVVEADGTIASGSKDSSVRLWTVAGRPRAVLEGHTARVNTCAFSGTGRALGSASNDKTIRVWDVARARCVAVLKGHTRGVNCCLLSRDGRSLFSGAEDKCLNLWDISRLRLPALPWRFERVLWIGHTKQGVSPFYRLPALMVMVVLGFLLNASQAEASPVRDAKEFAVDSNMQVVSLDADAGAEEVAIAQESLGLYTWSHMVQLPGQQNQIPVEQNQILDAFNPLL